MSDQQFQLRIEMEVDQVDERGGRMGNTLRVNHRVDIGAAGFLEIAGILGKFHELAEKIKDERAA